MEHEENLRKLSGGTTFPFPLHEVVTVKLFVGSPLNATLLRMRSSKPELLIEMLKLLAVPARVIGNVIVLPEDGENAPIGARFTFLMRLLPESAMKRSWLPCGLLNTASPVFWIMA